MLLCSTKLILVFAVIVFEFLTYRFHFIGVCTYTSILVTSLEIEHLIPWSSILLPISIILSAIVSAVIFLSGMSFVPISKITYWDPGTRTFAEDHLFYKFSLFSYQHYQISIKFCNEIKSSCSIFGHFILDKH